MNSLGRKVLVAALSLLCLLAGSGAIVAYELRNWDDATNYVVRDYRRALLDGEFQQNLTRSMGEASSYVLTGNLEYRTDSIAALDRAGSATEMLEEIARHSSQAADAAHVRFLARQQGLLQSARQRIGRVLETKSGIGSGGANHLLPEIHATEADAHALWQEIVAHHRAERAENEEALSSHSRRAVSLVMASVVAFVIWTVFLFVYVRRSVVEPLKGMVRLATHVAAGDLTRTAAVTHGDEIGQLQRSFNQMIVELARQRRHVDALVERLSRARDTAEAASRAKSDFLANVSHEIRTPMNGVMVTLDLMHETAPSPEQRELADIARSSARGLLVMLNDLLDFSRIEAGKVALESVDFDPRQLIAKTVALHGPRATAKGLQTRCVVADNVPARVCGDPLRLGQILLNLLDNAIKFTEQGSIEVGVACEPPPPGLPADSLSLWLRFTVTDTGIGVSEEAAQRIFEPFQQAEDSTTRKYGGIGLGLGIARRLAVKMGGDLGFQSCPGKGSRFWFTARLLQESSCCTPPVAPPPAAALKLPPGRTVLLVEDNRDNREVMARMLTRRGLKVTTAENGRDAVELAGREHFDLVLMDCQMPEMDGFDATRAIRNLGGERSMVPIVALTAYGLASDDRRYYDAGFDDLVVKPYTVEEIEAALLRWLRAARSTPDAATPEPAPSPEPGSAARQP